MPNEKEIILKLKVDDSQVKQYLNKTLSGKTGKAGGTAGGKTISGTTTTEGVKQARKQARKQQQQQTKSAGGGMFGMSKSMGLMASAGLGIVGGRMIINRTEAIQSRRLGYAQAMQSNVTMASAGLMTGAQYEMQQHQNDFSNFKRMWEDIPIIGGQNIYKAQTSQEYQQLQVLNQREGAIQAGTVSSTMSAYNQARAMGYKMDKDEISRIYNINRALQEEQQGVSEFLKKKTQSEQGSAEMKQLSEKFREKYMDNTGGLLKENLQEIFSGWKELLSGDFAEKLGRAIGINIDL